MQPVLEYAHIKMSVPIRKRLMATNDSKTINFYALYYETEFALFLSNWDIS